MSNAIDYLLWRGDLSFEQDPFNSVDALLLSCLSYVDFEDIVPLIGEGKITIEEASNRFFEIHSAEELAADKSFIKFAPSLLRALAETERFKNAYLMNYVSDTDNARTIQFAVLEIVTSDGVSFISYRGTDDTIVAWKEDCYLSFMTVPAETEAAVYLQHIMEDRDQKVRLGGHSKGGHLAIFAAMNLSTELSDRIESIYNFDGPGFNHDVLDLECFKRIQPKILKYIPQTSIIGRIMLNTTEPVIVKSTEIGIMQHDPLSWVVEGKEFTILKENDAISNLLNDTIDGWLEEMDFDARKSFVDDLFSVFEASGCGNVSLMPQVGIRGTRAMLEQMSRISKASSEKVKILIKILIVNINKLSGSVAKEHFEENNKVLSLVADLKNKAENNKK